MSQEAAQSSQAHFGGFFCFFGSFGSSGGSGGLGSGGLGPGTNILEAFWALKFHPKPYKTLIHWAKQLILAFQTSV